MNQVPDYIRKREGTKLAQRAFQNIGGTRPAHLSIKDNRFTLVDAAGERRRLDTLYVDIVVVDANDNLSKLYYANNYSADSAEMPDCFSDNGVGPSSQAPKPQHSRCSDCPQNVWGSKVNQQGNAVKACRDEQKLAFLVPEAGMKTLFQLTVPPNSLKAWKNYTAKFINADFDVPDVLTRVSFVDGVNGTLKFDALGYIPREYAGMVEEALEDPGRDLVVGRLDKPRSAAIASPAQQAALPFAGQPQAAPNQPMGTFTPAGFTPAAAPVEAPQAAPAAQAEPAKPRGRPRRQAVPAEPTGPVAAPFKPVEANGASPFGIGQGATPNAELAASIKGVFG